MLLILAPIQNDINELWTLLHYIEPELFNNRDDFYSEYGNLKETDQLTKLQARLSPFLLRRMKEDVATSILPKEETVVEVELTTQQKQYYRAVLEKNRTFLYKGCTSSNAPKLLNIVIQLRKVCQHPFLLREDKMVELLDPDYIPPDGEQAFLADLIANSGKLVLVDKLLPKLKSSGHRVLIFSQLKMVLDLLERYCQLKNYNYERIDGSIRGNDRQAAIDRFTRPDSDKFM